MVGGDRRRGAATTEPPPTAPRSARGPTPPTTAAAAEAGRGTHGGRGDPPPDARVRRPRSTGATWLDGPGPARSWAASGRAVVGWAPIALGIGWLVGEVSGCGRFSATVRSCRSRRSCLVAQVAVLAVLLLVPRLASVAAIAAAVTTLARRDPRRAPPGLDGRGHAIPAAAGRPSAVCSSSPGSSGSSLASLREVRRARPGDRSRILTACPDVRTSAICPPPPRNTCSPCAWAPAPSDGAKVTAAGVARHLGVTTQAASEMFRRLVADGLVDHVDGGRELRLTTAGRAAADAIFRRHALIEWLLTSVVGLGWAESDEEAMRLQGAISPRVEARLDEMLGHPETCPHGNPIDAATAKRRPPGVRLSEIEAGTPGHDLPHHRGGRGGRRAAVLPRGPGAQARARRSPSSPAPSRWTR